MHRGMFTFECSKNCRWLIKAGTQSIRRGIVNDEDRQAGDCQVPDELSCSLLELVEDKWSHEGV